MSTLDLPWLVLALLGAGHGINPGMGWLFAVALGLQEGRGRAVWGALAPLALGHAAAIAVALAAGALLGRALPAGALRWLIAGTLVGFGIFKLVRSRHPRYGGMKVGARDLAVWSFLMASAHGAGLMVLPFVLGGDAAMGAAGSATHGAGAGAAAGHAAHGGHGALLASLAGGGAPAGILVTAVHTAGYLLVTGLVALLVYRWLGLRLLRTAWINLDRLWAIALVLTGLVTPWL